MYEFKNSKINAVFQKQRKFVITKNCTFTVYINKNKFRPKLKKFQNGTKI